MADGGSHSFIGGISTGLSTISGDKPPLDRRRPGLQRRDMSRRPKPPPFSLTAPAATGTPPPPQLPLEAAQGVQVVLEGSDFVAVEAAAAELRARFGTRFFVTGRSTTRGGGGLRITGGLRVTPADALDAGGG